jgi:hypothetical protein
MYDVGQIVSVQKNSACSGGAVIDAYELPWNAAFESKQPLALIGQFYINQRCKNVCLQNVFDSYGRSNGRSALVCPWILQ